MACACSAKAVSSVLRKGGTRLRRAEYRTAAATSTAAMISVRARKVIGGTRLCCRSAKQRSGVYKGYADEQVISTMSWPEDPSTLSRFVSTLTWRIVLITAVL